MANRIIELLDIEDIYQSSWTEALDNMRPPERYVENCLGCIDCSSPPTLTDFVLHGFSCEEAARMRKFLYIEQMKRCLERKRHEHCYSPRELALFEASISERIREYNEGT